MSDKSLQLIGSPLRRLGEFYKDVLINHFLIDVRQIPVKIISLDRFALNYIGQNLNYDHGNIFRQDPKPFFSQTHKFLLRTAQNDPPTKSKNV